MCLNCPNTFLGHCRYIKYVEGYSNPVLDTYYICNGPQHYATLETQVTLKLAELNCIRNKIPNQMASANKVSKQFH